MGFVEQLKILVERSGATYAELDRAIGKTNQVGRIERKELPIPDRAAVERLGEALRARGVDTSGDRLWALAVVDKADPEVRQFFETAMERQRVELGSPLTQAEQNVITFLRLLAERSPATAPDALARWLAAGLAHLPLDPRVQSMMGDAEMDEDSWDVLALKLGRALMSSGGAP